MSYVKSLETPLFTVKYHNVGYYDYGFPLEVVVDGSTYSDDRTSLFDMDFGYAKKRLSIIPKINIKCTFNVTCKRCSDAGYPGYGSLVISEGDNVLYTGRPTTEISVKLFANKEYWITSPERYTNINEISAVPLFNCVIQDKKGCIYTITNDGLVLIGDDIGQINTDSFISLDKVKPDIFNLKESIKLISKKEE